MALSKVHKQKIVDALLEACNSIRYEQVGGDGYIVSPLGDEDIRLGSWDELFNTALYNNNEAVESLRRQGESDEDIKGYGFILTEDIAKWEKEEHATKVERVYTGGGIYIYRGVLADGRYFVASDDWGWEDCQGEFITCNPFAMSWDTDGEEVALFDGSQEFYALLTGETTKANIKDLWEFADEQVE